MSHDVFVCHASDDKTVADAVCHALEASGIRCWMAPRDVAAGGAWATSVLQGIESSSVLVLVFSSRANRSPHVVREVERAVSLGLPVLPLRVEDVAPEDDLGFFIAGTHWLDAVSPPVEEHLGRLVAKTAALLGAQDPVLRRFRETGRRRGLLSDPRPSHGEQDRIASWWRTIAGATLRAWFRFAGRPRRGVDGRAMRGWIQDWLLVIGWTQVHLSLIGFTAGAMPSHSVTEKLGSALGLGLGALGVCTVLSCIDGRRAAFWVCSSGVFVGAAALVYSEAALSTVPLQLFEWTDGRLLASLSLVAAWVAVVLPWVALSLRSLHRRRGIQYRAGGVGRLAARGLVAVAWAWLMVTTMTLPMHGRPELAWPLVFPVVTVLLLAIPLAWTEVMAPVSIMAGLWPLIAVIRVDGTVDAVRGWSMASLGLVAILSAWPTARMLASGVPWARPDDGGRLADEGPATEAHEEPPAGGDHYSK